MIDMINIPYDFTIDIDMLHYPHFLLNDACSYDRKTDLYFEYSCTIFEFGSVRCLCSVASRLSVS